MPSFCTKPKKLIFVILAEVVMQGVLIGFFDDAKSIPGSLNKSKQYYKAKYYIRKCLHTIS